MVDLFRFDNPSEPTDLRNGIPVTGYDRVMWLERYREAGEFELEAKLSSGLLDQLPIDSLVSHTDTLDVMVVEDHYISEKVDEDPKVKVTGRSLETLLDERIIGVNQNWSAGYRTIAELGIAAGFTWTQVVSLINTHIRTGDPINVLDAIPNLLAESTVSGTGESVYRVLKRGPLYKTILEILEVDNLGLRTIRAHAFASAFPNGAGVTRFIVHKGQDVSDSVRFSSDTGEVESAEYFWTKRNKKNVALVVGGTFEVLVEGESPPASKSDRRIMYVDGSDIDADYEEGMTQVQIDAIIANMQTFGRQALSAKNDIGLISVDMSRLGTYTYREDYDIGDTVSVLGTFGEETLMRVVEHVEIEDEESKVAYPTLTKV